MLFKSKSPLLNSQLSQFAKPRIRSICPQNKTGRGWQAGQVLLHSPCAEQSRVHSQLPAGFFLQIPGRVASGCPRASCFSPAPVEGSASETLRHQEKKKKEEDQLFIWDGNKAGERMGVFSFALRLENSRKRLLEEQAHGHQYDLCRLCCLEVGLQTGFCGG